MKVISKTPAKLNLILSVLGKRPDGFHELGSLVGLLPNIYDELHMDWNDGLTQPVELGKPAFHLELSEREGFKIPDLKGIPTDSRNLVIQAADLFFQKLLEKNKEIHVPQKINIQLYKGIPHQAGLGGASSDSACVLLFLNDAFKCPFTRADLMQMGSSLGSDLPLFFSGGLSIMEGRGERISPLSHEKLGAHALVLKPERGLSTARVYSGLQDGDYGSATKWQSIRENLLITDQISLDAYGKDFYNELEGPAFREYPQLRELKELMLKSGASASVLAGSGSSVVGLFDDQETCTQAKNYILECEFFDSCNWYLNSSPL